MMYRNILLKSYVVHINDKIVYRMKKKICRGTNRIRRMCKGSSIIFKVSRVPFASYCCTLPWTNTGGAALSPAFLLNLLFLSEDRFVLMMKESGTSSNSREGQ